MKWRWRCEICTQTNRITQLQCGVCQNLAHWWPVVAIQLMAFGVMGGVFGLALALALMELLNI